VAFVTCGVVLFFTVLVGGAIAARLRCKSSDAAKS
jgi:hypothetical protein